MASHYRAVRDLRRNGLHKALGLEDGAELTKEHLDRAGKSENSHVSTMAQLWHRANSKKGEKASPADEKDSSGK